MEDVMTSSTYRYYRLCPRGFANEVTYFRVPLDKITEVDAYFVDYEDRNPGASTGWTEDTRARQPGVAVDWADRAYVGLFD
jgi:hypothetical protein